MSTAALLVLYTEAFADTAVQVFTRMVNRVDPACRIVVVTNNPRIDLSVYQHVVGLQASNELHEFGAWQTGLTYLQGLSDSSELRLVWFANDTFCHYRPMGALEQTAFVRGARRAMGTQRGEACGELALSPWRRPYDFDGVTMRMWIATYLFALNRPALDALGWQVQPALAEVKRWVPAGATEEHFFAASMPPLISQHFRNWLFGAPGRTRWRRAAALTTGNHAMMQGKAYALVCEQILTAGLLRGKVQVRSVFHGSLIRALRKVLALSQ